MYNHVLLGGVAGRSAPWRANAAASLHTTAQDYARFLAAVLAGRGLRQDQVVITRRLPLQEHIVMAIAVVVADDRQIVIAVPGNPHPGDFISAIKPKNPIIINIEETIGLFRNRTTSSAQLDF